ncbi:hypothetical protein GVX82_02750 [Patescibacteria group bacterium]|jgi:uncharacterized secreted protein with C-terminal beta-propeller domain|nr:hypothetical protein [Patescibacteria group bacterium]
MYKLGALLGAICLVVGALFSMSVSAASDCSLLDPDADLPRGTASSWSEATGDRLLTLSCGEGSATVTAGSGGSDLVYERLYTYFQDYGWGELKGDTRVGPWIRGEARAQVPLPNTPGYLLAYVCENVGGRWDCGGGWRIQAYQRGAVADHPEPSPLKRVASADDLSRYLAESEVSYFGAGVQATSFAVPERATLDMDTSEMSGMRDDAAVSAPLSAEGSADSPPSRVSETNVQVSGIDEPDIVKTDGEALYVSKPTYYRWIEPLPAAAQDGSVRAPEPTGGVSVVDPYPAEELAVLNTEAIDRSGELLLDQAADVLMVIGSDRVDAYDVSDPASPSELWSVTDPDARTRIKTARLSEDGKLLLVTERRLGSTRPCPVPLMSRGTTARELPCTDIWVPRTPEPVNTLYSLARLDTTTGAEEDRVSFAGESSHTVVSVFSEDAYLATRRTSAFTEVMFEFYLSEVNGLLGPARSERMERVVASDDLSARIKLMQVAEIVEEALAELSIDQRRQWENDLQDSATEFLEERKRELDRTLVTRIDLGNLSVAATGEVPGHLLNQFSMDAWEGHLRVSATIGDRWSGRQQENDVYVLNDALEITGSIQGLGLDERIYATRFIGPRGYLVTFREIDPFYVLDLSDPTDPQMVGELKIPGFSSYLEPLSNDLVLGVGREGRRVKLSLFDVSDTSDPQERDVYHLDEGWSEVGSNHRAFLRDPEHDLFFIPAGQSGYVFSWGDDEITLERAVADVGARRAIYIDDVLYVVGEAEIRALSLPELEDVASLELR